MAHDLYGTQQTIFEYAKANLAFDVYTGGIEEARTLACTNGELRPHVILRFGSPQPYQADTSFGGARFDGAYSAVDAMVVAPSDDFARKLGSKVGGVLLGHKPNADSGALNYDWGGGTFTVISENTRPQFFINWVSFRFVFNLSDVGA